MTTATAPSVTWTDITTVLAETLDNFESRAEQDRLAAAIEDALANGEHLLGQAGCGTGKSFAYLAAAVAHAKATRKPVIVATATKALQDQIAAKDGPFLAAVLAKLFGDIRIVLVKGRGNYVCLDKLHGDAAEDVPNIGALREELESNLLHTGDFDNLITEVAPEHRLKLVTTGEECPGRSNCPFGQDCFAELAKDRAQEATVVVTNHAMLIRDVQVREMTDGVGGLLPEASAYVIDEGHEFEEYVRGALGSEITDRTLVRFGDDVSTYLAEVGAGSGLRRASDELFKALTEMLGEKDSKVGMDEEALAEHGDALVLVLTELEKVLQMLRSYRPVDQTESMQRKRLVRRLENLDAKVRQIILAEADDLVRWVEREVKVVRDQKITTIKLAFSPIDVGPYLAENLWTETPAVLVSATLALGDDFSFIARSLGLAEYTGFDAGSPFDFAKQSALYVPGGRYPEPTAKREEWTVRTQAETGELVEAAGGRALLLYTSRRAMDAAYEALAPRFRRMGLTVLRQGDAPLPQLVATKKAEPTSVLFGLRSLMTGVDFQGDAVRLVVIDKLPFSVPDDIVFEARCKVIDDKATNWNEKSFMSLAVPTMALTLFQAHGRAIRTRDDEALIAILDPRIRTKSYGKRIMRALPRSKDIQDLANATEYLRDVAARRDVV